MGDSHSEHSGYSARAMRLSTLLGSHYVLGSIIGQGGNATVWKARDEVNARDVAVKVLREELSSDHEFLQRFRAEAHAALSLRSAHIVATYDYMEEPAQYRPDGAAPLCAIVMEYVPGTSLADILHARGALPEEEALSILEQAAAGLAELHSAGVVHRDIKPGNILITPDEHVKLADFGIAKAAEAAPLTRTGMVVGTAQYVSPEAAAGGQVSPASDVYSLGVVGYEMLTGSRPFRGETSVAVALAHIHEPAPLLPDSISEPTRILIAVALRKDPAARFPDGTAFMQAISAARFGMYPTVPEAPTELLPAETTDPTQVLPASDSPAPRAAAEYIPERRSTTRRWIIALIVLLIVVLLGALWFAFRKDSTHDGVPAGSSVTASVTKSATPTSTASPTTKTSHPTTTTAPTPQTHETTRQSAVPHSSTRSTARSGLDHSASEPSAVPNTHSGVTTHSGDTGNVGGTSTPDENDGAVITPETSPHSSGGVGTDASAPGSDSGTTAESTHGTAVQDSQSSGSEESTGGNH